MQPGVDPIVLCRVCLTQKPPGTEGTSNFLTVSEEIDNQPISEMIESLAGISCFAYDNSPDEVCRSCAQDVYNAMATKNRCLKSDLEFRKTRQVKSEPFSLNGVQIKLVKCEPDLPLPDDNDASQTKDEHLSEISSKAQKSNTLSRTRPKKTPDSDSDPDFSEEDAKAFAANIKEISSVIETLTQLLPQMRNKNLQSMMPSAEIVEGQIPRKNRNKVVLETLYCCKCTEVFHGRGELMEHFTEMHQDKIDSEPIEPDNPNQCYLCRKTYTNAKNLDKHQKRIFFAAQRYERYRQTKPENQCSVCQHVYAHLASKELCERRHAGLERIPCPRPGCKKTLKNRQNLLGHLKLHDFPDLLPFHCEFCGKKFRNMMSLNSHVQMHNELKPFECAICEKKFKRKKCVEIHMRIHTGERPYQCAVCPNTYIHYTDLKRHGMIHTGQRPYKCQFPDCNKGFIKRSSLQSHEKSHNILD